MIMKRSRPKQHVRRMKSGKKVLINPGVSKRKPVKRTRKRLSTQQQIFLENIAQDLPEEKYGTKRRETLPALFSRIAEKQYEPVNKTRKRRFDVRKDWDLRDRYQRNKTPENRKAMEDYQKLDDREYPEIKHVFGDDLSDKRFNELADAKEKLTGVKVKRRRLKDFPVVKVHSKDNYLKAKRTGDKKYVEEAKKYVPKWKLSAWED